MRLLLVTLLTLSHWLFSFNSAFTFTANTCVINGIRKSTHLQSSLAEVEALLARARALRVDAESAEKDLQKNVIDKKSNKNSELDKNIDSLFFSGSEPIDKLRDKRLATDCLVGIVQRLHEREMIAKGLSHVEAVVGDSDNMDFELVSTTDEEEVVRLEGLIDKLLETSAVLDNEFRERESGNSSEKTADWSHYTHGQLEDTLREKANNVRREQSDQFKRRQEEFKESVVRKFNRSADDDKGPGSGL
mmetsp:Transcript_41020/g.47947  ORF Transcript_41020/g.47947 Transcript_41020/m.47947 type:complete len:247 (-) Transcript_41020:173-913(-)|eukprot:CAMPEP_0194379152 /NCGR_PEP_ID=MMETSP0174-20130528/38221_1 /TAXON_ID=216777 /ORGANISM="Proboscia alata, Strain PI-D3" /LENGTH=246 /DNA_ID=CAMNT_0039161653 /DNA_START=75 /DNA_END=815 /DNA_ORIENTATION=+